MRKPSFLKTGLGLALVFLAVFENTAQEKAAKILSETGIQGGLIVHLGCGDGKLTAALHADSRFVVQGIDGDREEVERAREHIRSLNLYGPVSAEYWNGRTLPYVDNLVNLIVVSGECQMASEEIARVLAPNGVVLVSTDDPATLATRHSPLATRPLTGLSGWTAFVKPRPDDIDLDAARAAGVQVATMPLRGCIAVAELAITLLLSLSKNLIRAHEATVSGAYRELGVEPIKTEQRRHNFQWMKLPGLLEVFGHTLGIIGFGRIGKGMAKRAQGFDMQVLHYDPFLKDDAYAAQVGAQSTDLDTLLRESDFVSVHTPLTEETYHYINADALSRMKPTAILINTARGPVVDPDALYHALKEGAIRSAALDVTEPEPVPMDHPLLTLDNVIITPHIASASVATRSKMAQMAADNLIAGLKGERLPNCVNPEVYK